MSTPAFAPSKNYLVNAKARVDDMVQIVNRDSSVYAAQAAQLDNLFRQTQTPLTVAEHGVLVGYVDEIEASANWLKGKLTGQLEALANVRALLAGAAPAPAAKK